MFVVNVCRVMPFLRKVVCWWKICKQQRFSYITHNTKNKKHHATSSHYTRLSLIKVSAHISRSYHCISLLPVVDNSPFVSWASFAGDSSEDTEFVFSGRLLRSRVNRLSLLPYLVQDKVKTTNHNRKSAFQLFPNISLCKFNSFLHSVHQKILNFPMANYNVHHVRAHHVGCWHINLAFTFVFSSFACFTNSFIAEFVCLLHICISKLTPKGSNSQYLCSKWTYRLHDTAWILQKLASL